MYLITFRGRGGTMTVDDRRGAELARIIEDTPDQMVFVNLDGKVVRLSSIVSVEPMREDNNAETLRDRNMQEMHKKHLEYEASRLKTANLPAEEKAKIMDIPLTVWFAHTAEKVIPEGVKIEIEARQLAWFKDHPKNAYCNPIAYKDIINRYEKVTEERPRIEKSGGARRIDLLVRSGALSFVERVLQSDNSAANRV